MMSSLQAILQKRKINFDKIENRIQLASLEASYNF